MRLGAGLLLAIAVLCALPAAAENEESERLRKEGKAKFEAGEQEEGLALLDQARKADPASPSAELQYAMAVGKMGRWEEACASFEKTCTLESPQGPRTMQACMNLGNYWANVKGDREKGMVYYRRATLAVPTDFRAWRELALTLANLERWADSLDATEKCLKCNPDQQDLKDLLPQLRERVAGAAKKAIELLGSPASVGGWVATPDLKAVYVSVPTKAEVQLLDTTAKAEPKRGSLDFQPGRLALQGKVVFAVATGVSKLYALDQETLKPTKTIKLPGSPLVEIACHRTRSLVYGAPASGEVVSIDPASGKVTATQARGTLLAVDPVKQGAAGLVFTASASQDDKPASPRTVLRKYSVLGADLKLVETNVAVPLRAAFLQLTHDGKRVLLAGEGAEAGSGVVAAYDTDSIATGAGRIAVSGRVVGLALHPHLDVGVVACEKSVVQFSSRSLVETRTCPVEPALAADPGALVFGAKGTKLVTWQPGDAAKKEEPTLGLFAIQLSPEETAALEKALAPPPAKPK